MLITKDFIILNNPKTGSTFVKTILKEIHKRRIKKRPLLEQIKLKLGIIEPELIELILPNIRMPNKRPDHHGTFNQIPKQYLNRPIFSVVRNPYSRFLSAFEYREWARVPALDKSIIKRDLPDFPNLDLDGFIIFLDLSEKTRLATIAKGNKNKEKIGQQTLQFIQLFFDDPGYALENMNDQYITSGEYRKNMKVSDFLKQENLEEGLINLLSQFNYTQEEMLMVKKHKKVNVTIGKSNNRDALWTTKSLNYIKEREKYLFKMLEDLGIIYSAPKLIREKFAANQ